MMDTPMAMEVNCETGETVTRPLTSDEIAERETARIEYEQQQTLRQAEEKKIADAKASASAKLAKLGLTESEISALVG